MPNWLDLLMGGQAPQFPQQQPPQSPQFVPQQMAIAPTFAQAPQLAQDVAAGIADPLLKAGNYLGGIMQGSQQFSWPETIQHGAALAMAMAPGPKGERLAAGAERGLARTLGESAAGQLAGQVKPPIDVGTVPGGIRAYHGSPYDFPAFDISKIGTGEGAQAYGHGLYMAENEATAKAYRDQLAGTSKGHMYEVNIKAQPEQFLDWDKPLSEQSPHVQAAFGKIVDRNIAEEPGWAKLTGREALQAAVERGGVRGGGEAALREAGIPGIVYNDQLSRNLVNATNQHLFKPYGGELDLPKPTRNYVVFNDKLIDIMRKYGLIGALGGSMSAPYFAPQGQQQ